MTNPVLERLYDQALADHLKHYRQMAFVSGPRQVGKTTTCRSLSDLYLDWDNQNHRDLILQGPDAVAAELKLERLAERAPTLVFDELHKYSKWKSFLKGFFDTYGERCHAIVTGSSRLDVYKRGGDSLMGRYFIYRMHPLGVSELLRRGAPDEPTAPPRRLDHENYRALIRFGPYPEPFLHRDRRFSNRWNRLRHEQLFKEDLRELTRIQELGQVEALGKLLASRSGCQIVYSSLAKEVRVDDKTIRNWIAALISLHYGFIVKPWYRNVAKALIKEPKWYLRDWSSLADPGQRAETFIACHLLKAVEGWTDLGLGTFELRYLRDKQKREVDFLVVRDEEPWFMVEVKTSATKPTASLEYFHRTLNCAHAFQVVTDLDYVQGDCFSTQSPTVVPAITFLSQLSV